jgi:hypothetical protein
MKGLLFGVSITLLSFISCAKTEEYQHVFHDNIDEPIIKSVAIIGNDEPQKSI